MCLDEILFIELLYNSSRAYNLGGHFMGQLKGQAIQYSVQLVKQVGKGYPRALCFNEMIETRVFFFDFP